MYGYVTLWDSGNSVMSAQLDENDNEFYLLSIPM